MCLFHSIMTMSHSAPTEAVPNDPQETVLLAGLREGIPKRTNNSYALTVGDCLAVARRFLPSEEDARDALQDAFLSRFGNS